MASRAIVRDEKTGVDPYFVYIERDGQGASSAVRFAWRSSAERVAAAINRALEREGKA